MISEPAGRATLPRTPGGGRWIVGVDIGGTNIVVGIIPVEGGDPVGLRTLPTEAGLGSDFVVRRVASMIEDTIRDTLAERGGTRADVLGVGIGSPGPLDRERGLVLKTPNLGWTNLPLRDLVSDADPNHELAVHRAQPAGALLCLEVETGKQVWRVDRPNGVLEKPAVDAHQVYAGCRDGVVYRVSRLTGKPRWQRFVGSPVVAAVALAKCSDCEATSAVYVVATDGQVCCLDPATGAIQWTYLIQGRQAHLVSSPRSLCHLIHAPRSTPSTHSITR